MGDGVRAGKDSRMVQEPDCHTITIQPKLGPSRMSHHTVNGSYGRLTDEQLMERFQKGDQQAFDHLFQRYQPRLQRVLNSYTRNPEDTRDLIQETFLRVHRSRKAYRQVARFSTWIFTIALNQARSHHRRNRRRESIQLQGGTLWEGEILDVQPMDTDLLQDERMQVQMQLDCTVANLEKLNEEYRTAVVLRDYLHLSYGEIMKKTGLALGTVKSRISRGRRILQDGVLMMESERNTPQTKS